MASRNFVILVTDGTRAVEDSLDDERPATVLSILDHYRTRPTTSDYNDLTLSLLKILRYQKMIANPSVEIKQL